MNDLYVIEISGAGNNEKFVMMLFVSADSRANAEEKAKNHFIRKTGLQPTYLKVNDVFYNTANGIWEQTFYANWGD